MRFSADVSVLREALALAFGASGGRFNPILGQVHCAAEGDRLVLTGTDNETAVRVGVVAEVCEPGECLLPPTFATVVREAGSGTVEVKAGKAVIVSVNGDVFDLPTEDSAGFPVVADAPEAATLTVGTTILRSALDRTAFAAARDEGKYAMRCVAWDVGANGVKLAATDGKRLAVADLVPEGAEAGLYLFPTKATDIVRKLCEAPGLAKVVLRANDAFVTTETGTLYTRLVEGRFPPWRDVVPKKGPTTVELDSESFCRAVRRAALTTDAEAKRVTCEFRAGGVVMSAQGGPGRSVVTHVPKSMDGPPVDIHLAPEYLADVARLGGEVTLSLIDPGKSVVFRADGSLLLVVPLV